VANGDADVRFFFGRLNANKPLGWQPGEVWLDCADDYAGLPLKVQSICRWSAEQGYEETLICDDDVYVAPKRFPHLPLDADYIGRCRSPYGKVYPQCFPSGFAQWLSARATGIVANTPWNGDWMDERFIATALAYHGVFCYNDPVSYLVTGPHLVGKDIGLAIHKAGTVFCEYGPVAMLEMHKVFKDALPVPGHPGLKEQPHVLVTDYILNSPPGDKIPQGKLERVL
jgi:hypothetical protein